MSRVILIVLAFQFAVVACSRKSEPKVEASVQTVNEYPRITLRLAEGKDVAAKELRGNNMFVLFQPDCDHCQEEAIQIQQRLQEFKDYTLYFISSAPMENIISFARNFDLDNVEKVKFAWTSTEGVLTYYGPIQTPSIYIYSDGRLKQSFNGQTSVDKILEAL